jgi:hypothetical protein
MDPITATAGIVTAARLLAPIAGSLILAVERAIPGEQKGLQKFGAVLESLKGAQVALTNEKQIAEPLNESQLAALIEARVQAMKETGTLGRGVFVLVGKVTPIMGGHL